MYVVENLAKKRQRDRLTLLPKLWNESEEFQQGVWLEYIRQLLLYKEGRYTFLIIQFALLLSPAICTL